MATPSQIQCRPVPLLWMRRAARPPFFSSTAFASLAALSGAILDVIVPTPAPSPGTGAQSLAAASGELFDIVVTAAAPSPETASQRLTAASGALFDTLLTAAAPSPGTGAQNLAAGSGEIVQVIVPYTATGEIGTQSLALASGTLS